MLLTNLLVKLHLNRSYLDLFSTFELKQVKSVVHYDLSEIHTDIYTNPKNINCSKINIPKIL